MIWHSTPKDEVLKELGVDSENGLPNGVVDERIFDYGKNVITKNDRITFLQRFLTQFKSKVVIILIIAAIVSFVVSGVILGALGLYKPLVELGGAGATVPASSMVLSVS